MPYNIYEVDARVKNHVAREGIPLSAAGIQMCNMFTHVLMSLYEYSETLPEPYKSRLTTLIESKENTPAQIIKLVNPEPVEDLQDDFQDNTDDDYDECF